MADEKDVARALVDLDLGCAAAELIERGGSSQRMVGQVLAAFGADPDHLSPDLPETSPKQFDQAHPCFESQLGGHLLELGLDVMARVGHRLAHEDRRAARRSLQVE